MSSWTFSSTNFLNNLTRPNLTSTYGKLTLDNLYNALSCTVLAAFTENISCLCNVFVEFSRAVQSAEKLLFHILHWFLSTTFLLLSGIYCPFFLKFFLKMNNYFLFLYQLCKSILFKTSLFYVMYTVYVFYIIGWQWSFPWNIKFWSDRTSTQLHTTLYLFCPPVPTKI